MRTLTKAELEVNKSDIYQAIKEGSVFIHPTDTIYGLGCDATNENAVNKVRELKDRPENPFSVIAPSKKWIKENCEINKEAEEWLNKLPGPYTLIMKLKNKDAIVPAVNGGTDTLGVRMPSHWFSEVAKELDTPLITTSANKVGKDFMTSLENLDSSIKADVDFAVYEGEKEGRPSTLVHLEGKEIKVRKR